MTDITQCGTIINQRYPSLKDAYNSLCEKLKETGGKGIIEPNGNKDRFTEDERRVFYILSVEIARMQYEELLLSNIKSNT
jgi:hypothetical protein